MSKIQGGSISEQDYLSRDNTNCLKGIFAIIIVITHFRSMTTCFNDSLIGMALTALGYLSVAVFFFFSGYGLWFSVKKSKDYINKFPRNRLLDFYAKYILLALIYAVFHFGMDGELNPVRILMTGALLDNVIVFGWYLQAVLILYLIFWLVVRFVPLKGAGIRALLMTLLYIIAVLLLESNPKLYLQSVLSFPLGILWCENKHRIDRWLMGKKYFISLLATFVSFGIFLLLGNFNILSGTLTLIAKMISASCFVAVVLILVKPLNINNAVTRKLGSISFEIYVLQGIFLNLFLTKIKLENVALYLIVSLLSTVALSFVMHPVFNFISQKIKR